MVSKWTTLEDSWKVLDSLADPYVGIVRREYRKLRDVDDVWGHSYGAHGTDSEILFESLLILIMEADRIIQLRQD